MAIPTADQKLDMIQLAEPTEAELRAVVGLAPGDYEIGFQRTNDILDEALEVFQRSSRSSMGIAGDVMIAMLIERSVEITLDWTTAAIMSIVLLVVTLVLYGIYYRLTDVRQMMGA